MGIAKGIGAWRARRGAAPCRAGEHVAPDLSVSEAARAGSATGATGATGPSGTAEAGWARLRRAAAGESAPAHPLPDCGRARLHLVVEAGAWAGQSFFGLVWLGPLAPGDTASPRAGRLALRAERLRLGGAQRSYGLGDFVRPAGGPALGIVVLEGGVLALWGATRDRAFTFAPEGGAARVWLRGSDGRDSAQVGARPCETGRGRVELTVSSTPPSGV